MLRTGNLRPGQKWKISVIHEVIPVGVLSCNCSILGDEETGEAVVIDPGDDIEQVREILERHKLKVKLLIATHAHIDHVGGIEKLKRESAHDAAMMLHEEDLFLYQHLAQQAAWLGVPVPGSVEVDQFLKEGQTLRCGGIKLDVLHTPGHSPGSVCLHMPGEHQRIFSGDTLFNGSIGRTDLWGGSSDEIMRSIRGRLLVFDDALPIYPGHGEETTIGQEREGNPFLRGL